MERKPTYEELERKVEELERKVGCGPEKIKVSDINIEWSTNQGVCTFEKLPIAMMWIDTTLAGLMSGVQAMVGTERFGLALQSEGRKSVDEDWRVISQFSDFLDGFKAIANIAAVAGWGEWKLTSLDENEHQCTFRIKNGWEGRYQKALGVNWGSGMLAGKMAGYSSKLFKTNCWAEQTRFIAKGDEFDEFVVKPSNRSVENEIENLLLTDEATRADMAVALEKLQKEVLERKQAEEALRESEEKYRQLVENANDAIFIIEDGKVKFPNFKTEEMTGYSEKELSEIPFKNIIHPDDREMVLERRRKRLLGEKLPSIYSFRMIHKSGGELLVQINTVLIAWEGKPATINFIRDITEQKRLEAQLQQAQKMESVGTLAGGIAHDFNNLLMGILGRTTLISADVDSFHPHTEHLKEIEEYVKSAADLTKQLLGFARGGRYIVEPTELNELIKNQSQMFGRTQKDINIQEKYEKDLWVLEVDRKQIEQVLLNLYVNSWQAMPEGGSLYIQTENIVIDEYFNRPYHVEPGKYVKVSITDTGVGMDEATQQRIFDPFFTTKEMGRGTGLGLASAYGIIKNHNGFIDVYSKKGEGTTFNIYLPTSEKEAVKEVELHEELFRGTETLLLVDDEDMIVDVGCGIIEKLGYKVLTAKSGEEAIVVYKKNHDKIDMVIIDMVMPEMGGGETYDKLKEINPGIKVLLSSGYSINGQATEILERGCNGFIQKPFNMADLSKKIREVLDKD